MKTIETDQLKSELKKKNIVLIEVLEKEDFDKEHIGGAIHIPMNKIGTEAKQQFNLDEKIVVYCSDENCSASSTAAKKLKDLGFKNVFHYKGGKKAWKEAGLPTKNNSLI